MTCCQAFQGQGPVVAHAGMCAAAATKIHALMHVMSTLATPSCQNHVLIGHAADLMISSSLVESAISAICLLRAFWLSAAMRAVSLTVWPSLSLVPMLPCFRFSATTPCHASQACRIRHD